MADQLFNGSAKWIWSSEGCWNRQPNSSAYRVRYFRRAFVPAPDCRLEAHVSADSRYILWFNDMLVSRGPAKGDVAHQFYDTVDLTPLLRQGRNVLAAQVMSYADSWPLPQYGGGVCSVMTAMGALIVDAELVDPEGRLAQDLGSGKDWRVLVDQAFGFIPPATNTNVFVGMGEVMEGARYPWGWHSLDYDDSGWEQATELERGYTAEMQTDAALPYRLVPRVILPLEEEGGKHFAAAYGADEATVQAWQALLDVPQPVHIPPHTAVHIGLDAGALTTGYPELQVEGGAGSEIKLTYGEAQWRDGKKGPRDDLNYGTLEGIQDIYRPSGAAESWQPFHFRAFRFIELDITTQDEPLTIASMTYRFTAYPCPPRAGFECSDQNLNKMWEVSWRTAQLCAHETYEDSPTFGQLQYGRDAYLQSLTSYVTSGIPDLAKQAIRHFDWSRNYEGLTAGRYPSRIQQMAPFASLYYVLMVHDYYWFTGDLDEVNGHLGSVASVLRWFEERIGSSGLVENVPYWCTVDSSPDWHDPKWGEGVPPGVTDGPSALINFMFAYCLDTAMALYLVSGQQHLVTGARAQASRLRENADKYLWSEEEGLYYDRPGGPELSQLANAWAILCGAANAPKTRRILRRLTDDPALCRAGLFGMHHVFRALAKAGAYSRVFDLLTAWRHILNAGVSTWPETSEAEVAYTDCHAQSLAPTYELATKVLGIQPAAPGFSRVLIRPFPGYLNWARGAMPTPHGDVEVAWNIEGRRMIIEGQLPSDVPAIVVLPGGQQAEFSGGSFRVATDLPAEHA